MELSAQDIKKQVRLLTSENHLLRKEIEQLQSLLEKEAHRHRDLERRLSIHPKTGLPNHNKLDHYLVELLSEKEHEKQPSRVALVIVKLDNKYEMVNKTLKASIAEWVLYQIGNRLAETLEVEDRVFHSRDEEFILIFNNVTVTKKFKERLYKIYEAVKKPHVFSGYHITIGCHMGVAFYPEHGQRKNNLLHNADIALEYGIQNRRGVELFREDMRNEVVEKMELQNSILKALESQAIEEMNKQFEIYLQPQMVIESLEGREIRIKEIHAEVLLRWNHPTRGLLVPGKFIPVAEETGLIQPMGNWVFFRTVEQLKAWSIGPLSSVILSLNISPKQFSNELFLDNVIRILSQRGIPKDKIKMELTETSIMDDPRTAIRKMEKLTEYGVEFLIDDFGSGYSSLNYLQKLPVSTIKIDKSFVNDLGSNRQDEAIVRAIVAMAKEIGFNIIVEGVEKFSQLKFLHREGCDTIQGFYFARPMPVSDFEEYVKRVGSSSLVLGEEEITLI